MSAINKGRRSQILADFCIFSTKIKSIFNTLDVVFEEIFLLFPSTAHNFVHNRVIGLVIKSEHCFQ